MSDQADTRLDPPWLFHARKFLGTVEIPGALSNPQIERFHAPTAGGATDDSVAWCSSFACFAMEAASITSPKSKRALSWIDWGDSLPAPVVGAVAVFDHGGGKGHVAFVVGKTAGGLIVCLGGNQSDRVKLSAYSYDHLAGFRYPSMPAIDLRASAGESTR